MTSGQATSVLPSLLADETRMPPRRGQGAAAPAEASPLWPLVRLLAEIAARVEREQTAKHATVAQDAPERPEEDAV